ncbi:MAG: hypothetical protein L6R28_17520 [Planctomycetes bacterium]|nr:hypothetical protein [Planctomycetota bacterium]
MEEDRTANPDRPGERDARNLSDETIILPKGLGVAASARAKAPVPAARAEESKWGARLAGVLRAVTVAWILWFLCLAAMFSVPVGSLSVTTTTFFVSGNATVFFFFARGVFGSPGPITNGIFAGSFLSSVLSGFLLFLFNHVSPAAGRAGWMIAIAGLFVAMVVLALARIVFQLLAEVQTRLGELLLALLFMGLLMTLAVTCAPLPDDRVLRAVLTVVYLVPPVLLAAGGATWSWTVARMLGEEDGKRRLLLMLKGWFMIVGFGAFATFAVTLLALIAEGTRLFDRSPIMQGVFLGSLCLIPAMFPGLAVQRRAKRAAANGADAAAAEGPA